jgi:hypothetical protein
VRASVLSVVALELCSETGKTEGSAGRRKLFSSMLNFVDALSAAPRVSPKRSTVCSAEEGGE